MQNSSRPNGIGGAVRDAEQNLREAIALAPGNIQACADLASLLVRLERTDEAISLLENVAKDYPGEIWPLSLKAAVLTAERRADEALTAHKSVVARAPYATVPWMNYAHALQAIGNTEQASFAYRKSLELDPDNGSSWWGLANLKTFRFAHQDVTLMEQAIARQPRDPLRHIHLHFALGKALSDLGSYDRSFRHYEEANRLRGRLVPYDATATSNLINELEHIFTAEFFAERNGSGCDGDDVIFIVGMPRSGSTLIEQILASHPMVEGAGELFELRSLIAPASCDGMVKTSLPESIAALTTDDLQTIGANYLRASRRYRRTDQPFFTDKMPSNWQLVPLILLSFTEK